MAEYTNAKNVLPAHLLHEVQQHVQGALLYIPNKRQRRPWGTLTGIRHELAARNGAMKKEYRQGASLQKLAAKYHLSQDTVRKIVRS